MTTEEKESFMDKNATQNLTPLARRSSKIKDPTFGSQKVISNDVLPQ